MLLYILLYIRFVYYRILLWDSRQRGGGEKEEVVGDGRREGSLK